jgi:hypothetical protein
MHKKNLKNTNILDYFFEIYNNKIQLIDNYKVSKSDFLSDICKKFIIEKFDSNKKLRDYVSKSNLYEILAKDLNFRFIICVENENFIKKNNKMICELLTITNFFNKYKNKFKSNILIIWAPISSNRDFHFNKINKNTIFKSSLNFEAFTTSGITFDFDEYQVSIISRIEEIQKLLIHELIHNVKLDMRNHNEFINLNENYKKIKNKNNYHYYYSLIEIFTEWSCVLYNILFKMKFFFMNLQKKNFIKIYKKIYQRELIHSLKNLFSIIKLNGYPSIKEFNNNRQKFFGEYSFYEYYYLKAFCMMLPINFYREQIGIYNMILILCSLPFPESLEKQFKNTKINRNFKFVLLS